MGRISDEPKQRVIQEYVPGKQITLAHVIASPHRGIYLKLGLDDTVSDALGILTITPAEGSDGRAPFYTLTFSSTTDENGSLSYRVAVKALRPGETAAETE